MKEFPTNFSTKGVYSKVCFYLILITIIISYNKTISSWHKNLKQIKFTKIKEH